MESRIPKPKRVIGNWMATKYNPNQKEGELAYPENNKIMDFAWETYVNNKPSMDYWDFLWIEDEETR